MPLAGLHPDQLRRRTIVSGFAALATRVTRAVLLLGSSVILARLLTPADFGIFAMVVPLGMLAHGFADLSFQTALLQQTELESEDVDAVFWFAAKTNLVVTGVTILAGLLLARFYREPRVIGVTVVMSAMISLLTLTRFQEVLLKRELRFAPVLAIELVAVVISIAASIGVAVGGGGYWALPVQVVTLDICRAVGIHRLSGWRPRRSSGSNPDRVATIRRSWWALVGLTMATWINDQPELLAMGRFGGAPLAGLYDTARRWAWYPFAEPSFAVTDVAVTSLSRVQNDPVRLKAFMTRAVLVMLTLSMPAIAFVGVEAASVVRVLLGPQWSAAAPVMRLLAIAAFWGSIARVTEWVYLALGRTHRLLFWSVAIRTPVLGLAVIIGVRHGSTGVASAVALATGLLVLPAMAFCLRETTLKVTDLLLPAARPMVASLVATIALVAAGGLLPSTLGIARLAPAFGVFGIGFAAVWLALPGGRAAFGELVAAGREFRSEASN